MMATGEFCTILDSNYLARGLVLYRSLAETAPGFRLHVACVDSATMVILERMALPGLLPMPFDELEAADPALRAVKGTRSVPEYCWTAKPSLCLHLLERESEMAAITYLDADLMFFHDPSVLFEEFADEAAIMIVPHRFPPIRQDWTEHSGIYNGQFATFRRDERALAALRWWRERCIEWCYNRAEGGKFADQKYLDDWPGRFSGVHVLEHLGGGLAPWNAAQYELERRNGKPWVEGQPVVFYHYQSLQLFRASLRARHQALWPLSHRVSDQHVLVVWRTDPDYAILRQEETLLWAPYVRRLGQAVADLRDMDPTFDAGLTPLRLKDVAVEAARDGLPALLWRITARARRHAAPRRSSSGTARP
jgi:hypothetical protein